MEEEVWKDIKGFENFYQVSNFGNVKSLNYKRSGKEHILSTKSSKNMYITVNLRCGKGKYKTFRIHRLVAEAFIPNPYDKPQVNHINGIKTDNKLCNLEWVTQSENVRHSMNMHPNQITAMVTYNKYVRPQKIYQLDMNGDILNTFNTAKEASKFTGVCARNILQCANFNSMRHMAGKFIWRFEGYEHIKTVKKAKKRGAEHPLARRVICVETKKTFGTIREAAQKCGVQESSICLACRKNKTAGGYHWGYDNEVCD